MSPGKVGDFSDSNSEIKEETKSDYQDIYNEIIALG
jgi:hypothetical protein